MLFVDNESFLFESIIDLEKGLLLIFDQFSKIRLAMHIGSRKKPSKLNAYYERNMPI